MNSKEIPPIELSVDLSEDLPSVGDRYYSYYYYVAKNQLRKKLNDPVDQDDSAPKRIKMDESSILIDSAAELLDQSKITENSQNLSNIAENGRDQSEMNGNGQKQSKIKENIQKYDWENMECKVTGEEPLIMVHTNKLCVISLSKYHPIVSNALKVAKVE